MSKNSSNLSTLCRRAAALLATLALLAAMTLPVYAEGQDEALLQVAETTADVATAPEAAPSVDAALADTADSDNEEDNEDTETNGEDELPAEDPTQETPINDIEDTTDTAGETTDTDITDDTENTANTQPADDAESTVDEIATQPAEAADDGIALYDVQYPTHVYFAVPENYDDSWTVKFNAKKGNTSSWVALKQMKQETPSYDGRRVFGVELTQTECEEGAFGEIQFQYFNGSGAYDSEYKLGWSSIADIAGKLFDAKSGKWVDNYEPFDPTNHKAFANKTMAFKNAGTKELTNVVAHFYEKGENGTKQEYTVVIGAVPANTKIEFSIPADACSYIQFTAEDGTAISSLYNFYGQDVTDENEKSFLYNSQTQCCFVYTAKATNWTSGGEGRTIYYDATFSKLAVENADYAIPNASGKVYCHLWNSNDSSIGSDDQVMTKVDNSGNLYFIEVDPKYNSIIFSNGDITKNNYKKTNGNATPDLKIPAESGLIFPCYYADTSDNVTYTSDLRDGYWDEVGQVRDAEAHKADKTVVNIPSTDFTADSKTKYIDSTLYDYYTDWELNGNNRDAYQGSNNPGTKRNWVTFRHFDQALSDYYTAYAETSNKSVPYPIYTGHFQPDALDGEKFSYVSGALNLYGWSDYFRFMAVNNSYHDIKGGSNLAGGGKDNTENYKYTFQGLVENTLGADGAPVMYGTTLAEPHFNKNFLEGANSKKAVLGKVYENVDFPFTQKTNY